MSRLDYISMCALLLGGAVTIGCQEDDSGDDAAGDTDVPTPGTQGSTTTGTTLETTGISDTTTGPTTTTGPDSSTETVGTTTTGTSDDDTSGVGDSGTTEAVDDTSTGLTGDTDVGEDESSTGGSDASSTSDGESETDDTSILGSQMLGITRRGREIDLIDLEGSTPVVQTNLARRIYHPWSPLPWSPSGRFFVDSVEDANEDLTFRVHNLETGEMTAIERDRGSEFVGWWHDRGILFTQGQARLTLVEFDGRVHSFEPAFYFGATASPTGDHVATVNIDQQRNSMHLPDILLSEVVDISDLESITRTPFTEIGYTEINGERRGIWSENSQHVAFVPISPDDATETVGLTSVGHFDSILVFEDGHTASFSGMDEHPGFVLITKSGTRDALIYVSLEGGTGEPRELVSTTETIDRVIWSPTNEFVIYNMGETVYVQNVTDADSVPWELSTSDGFPGDEDWSVWLDDYALYYPGSVGDDPRIFHADVRDPQSPAPTTQVGEHVVAGGGCMAVYTAQSLFVGALAPSSELQLAEVSREEPSSIARVEIAPDGARIVDLEGFVDQDTPAVLMHQTLDACAVEGGSLSVAAREPQRNAWGIDSTRPYVFQFFSNGQ